MTKPAIKTPRTPEEAAAYLSRIGEIDRELGSVQADLSTTVSAANRLAADKASPLRAERDELATALESFARKHRAALTRNGQQRTADLGTGKIGWKLNPSRIAAPDDKGALAKLIDFLRKSQRLRRFIRVKEDLDKQALLKVPEIVAEIPGLSIVQDEVFVIEPLVAAMPEVHP